MYSVEEHQALDGPEGGCAPWAENAVDSSKFEVRSWFFLSCLKRIITGNLVENLGLITQKEVRNAIDLFNGGFQSTQLEDNHPPLIDRLMTVCYSLAPTSNSPRRLK